MSPPSPVSCAKPPLAAPEFNARNALPDSDPKLIDDTFNSDMSYGRVQSGPPIRTRGGSSGGSTGAIEWTRYSYPSASRSRSVPNDCSAAVPFARS